MPTSPIGRINTTNTIYGSLDSRIIRFDAAADMPASITTASDVSGDRIKLDTFSTSAQNLQLAFHTISYGLTGTTVAAPICLGALVAINSADDNDANNRLTYVDLTGAGTSSAGKLNLLFVSNSNPFIEVTLIDPLIRLDVIGIYAGFTPTNIIPAFLEVRVS